MIKVTEVRIIILWLVMSMTLILLMMRMTMTRMTMGIKDDGAIMNAMAMMMTVVVLLTLPAAVVRSLSLPVTSDYYWSP